MSDLDAGAPRFPLLIGETHGREPVPLPGLPAGVIAVTVPRVTRTEEDLPDVRIPRDRKGRVNAREVDLVAAAPVNGYAPPPALSTRDLIKVLTTRDHKRWTTIEAEFGERAWDVAVTLVQCGAITLRCRVERATRYAPRLWRLTQIWEDVREDKLDELRGRPDPLALHAELLESMAQVPQLARERELLEATPPGRTLKVPADSTSRTGDWRIYEIAIRAACFWWPAQDSVQPITAKAVAGHALRNTKSTWTPSRQQAFANLIGRPFDQAVEETDTELRMRGPLQWRVGSVVADAAACRPWLGLPARGLRVLGMINCNAAGIVLVENEDAFQQVCKIPEIVDHWLCIWGAGYATDGLVEFLRSMAPLPVAAWQDLDAHGIRIIHNLAERIERPVSPVGMDVELYRAGPKYKQEPEKLEGNRQLASVLAEEGPIALRPLAAEIAANGGAGCEHETLYAQVLPTLAKQLHEVTVQREAPPTP
ncbi:Wadjet anti-phage system protein JetD domain-containing protein [Streptomyces sp. NPDC048644]|uniref:Wadjet anti-phage system protein JetD domain-containing protein n=1 Tax=Streptomyces sp. NPDC048644 TaxID=3365582 RepID=UPI00372445F5